jgi:hypothetical protein
MSALAELNRPPTLRAATPPRKRLVLEPDQDFFGPDNDEPDEEQPPSDIDMDDDQDALGELYASRDPRLEDEKSTSSVASSSKGTASIDVFSTRNEGNGSAKSGNDAKGKAKMTFEEDAAFGDEEFEFTASTTTAKGELDLSSLSRE